MIALQKPHSIELSIHLPYAHESFAWLVYGANERHIKLGVTIEREKSTVQLLDQRVFH
jgi:hypothetical protein